MMWSPLEACDFRIETMRGKVKGTAKRNLPWGLSPPASSREVTNGQVRVLGALSTV